MNNLICKLFGHQPINLNTERLHAECRRCFKHLKVSYDMFYGDTIVEGDYGDQKTFIWCDCGNELISSGSYHYYSNSTSEKSGFETYICAKCNTATFWDLSHPIPTRVKGTNYGRV